MWCHSCSRPQPDENHPEEPSTHHHWLWKSKVQFHRGSLCCVLMPTAGADLELLAITAAVPMSMLTCTGVHIHLSVRFAQPCGTEAQLWWRFWYAHCMLRFQAELWLRRAAPCSCVRLGGRGGPASGTWVVMTLLITSAVVWYGSA